ncbi:putative amine oxidase [Rhizodiscina lignyota]|uniref:Amine oxidase n=1 Tax=Rhizodiscina lignyota TaxID=1504668 RepID=A0A9P4M5I1_9PEZI|nr:putative amine oxidase [Rhizodiscina lignyota]
MATNSASVDVIVVGAGLSGLRAAVDIYRAGLSVLVLEARDRVGGKTLSLDSSGRGGKVDVGAAWINDSNQSEMYKLAREFGFDLVKQRASGLSLSQGPGGEVVTHPYGSREPSTPEDLEALGALFDCINHRVAEGHLEKPHLSPNAASLDSVTFSKFAADAGGDVAAQAASSLSAALLGVEADEVSVLFMLNYIQSGTGLENMSSDLKHGGQYLRNRQAGNQQFSVRLAALLPHGSLRLSTAVSRVSQEASQGCKVETEGSGPVFHAQRVILSIPTSNLPSVIFEPPLPVAKQALAENTALGYYAKTIFVFGVPWWREAGLSGLMTSAKGPISFTRDTCVEADKQYSITCFIVGDSGREWSKWSAAERRRQVEEQFDAVFGRTAREKGVEVPAPINIIEKEWAKDPWALGAPSPVMMPGLLTSDAGKVIREPFEKLHFVGTETALVWKGYMEGAVRSGVRGAQEVIRTLRKNRL